MLQLTGVLQGWPAWCSALVYLGPLAYLLLVLWVSLTQDDVPAWRNRWLFLIVLPTMHLSWGAGFIVGAAARSPRDTSTPRAPSI